MRAIFALACLGLCLLARAASAGPAIGEYTVYGQNGVVIGGGSHVRGLVGAGVATAAAHAALKLAGASSIEGDARSGDNVSLANGADISGTLTRRQGTVLTLGSQSSVGHDVQVADPELPALPAPAAFACPSTGPSFSGPNGKSLTLTPGVYGDVHYGGAFKLTLDGAGTYVFNSLAAANGATITITQPGVVVLVCGAASFGSAKVLPTTLLPSQLTLEAHAAGTAGFNANGGSQWIGNVYTPFGRIHFGGGSCCSSFAGRFWGDSVDLEHGVSGETPEETAHCPCIEASTQFQQFVIGQVTIQFCTRTDFGVLLTGVSPVFGSGSAGAELDPPTCSTTAGESSLTLPGTLPDMQECFNLLVAAATSQGIVCRPQE